MTATSTTPERILDAALSSFSARGYEATSLDALGAALGVRKQTVLHHYGSKEGLLQAVVDRAAGELTGVFERAVAGAGTGFAPVEALVREAFRLAARRPELLGLLREVGRLGPPASERLTAGLEPLVVRARAYLEGEVAAGSLRRHDPRLLLLSAYSMVIGVATEAEVLQGLGQPTARTLARRRAELLAYLRSALLPAGAGA